MVASWLERANEGDPSVTLADLQGLARSAEGTVEAAVEVVLALLDRVEGDCWFRGVAEGPLREADRRWAGAVVGRLGDFQSAEPRIAALLALVPPAVGPDAAGESEPKAPSVAERLSPDLAGIGEDHPGWLRAWREFEEGLEADEPAG